MKNFALLFCLIIVFSCQPNESNRTETSNEQPEMIPHDHEAMMNAWMQSPNYDIKTVGILVYDGVNDLDFNGPLYVLQQLIGVDVQLIALQPGNFKTVMGVEVVPNTVIDSVGQLDILVIPGGFTGTILGVYDEKLHDWIRMIDENTVFTTSVCTGGWILAATGLLEGKRATTNWYRADEMLAKYGATFVNERYTRDGKYWTSAGVTAGMDMSLAILNEVYGEAYTQGVMLDMEYDPAPPIEGGSPESTTPEIYDMMLTMYDMGIQPLMDSLDTAGR